METDLLALKRKIEALSPSARLLMASQLVTKDGDCIDIGMIIAENVRLRRRRPADVQLADARLSGRRGS